MEPGRAKISPRPLAFQRSLKRKTANLFPIKTQKVSKAKANKQSGKCCRNKFVTEEPAFGRKESPVKHSLKINPTSQNAVAVKKSPVKNWVEIKTEIQTKHPKTRWSHPVLRSHPKIGNSSKKRATVARKQKSAPVVGE